MQGFGRKSLGKGNTRATYGVGCRIILILIFRNLDVGVWTGLSWLRIGKCGRNMQMR
jgi:hypothetical protein